MTILIGVLLLGDVAPGSAPRPLLTAHVSVALVAAAVVCVAAVGAGASAAWIGASVATVTAGLGVTLYTRVPGRQSPGLLIAHGVGAAATVALVVLAGLLAR